jgi:hypothetical protein
MTPPRIETPRGMIVQGPNGKAELKWSTGFAPTWSERYSAAQCFVDSEVLRLSEPFIPLRTGMLIKSGILGTEIGSGEVAWIAPYARRQFYSPRKVGSETGPQRGPFWFTRMKAVHKNEIIEGAKARAGGSKGGPALEVKE